MTPKESSPLDRVSLRWSVQPVLIPEKIFHRITLRHRTGRGDKHYTLLYGELISRVFLGFSMTLSGLWTPTFG